MFDFTELVKSVVKGDISKAVELTRLALKAKVPAKEILGKGLVRAMGIVGEQFDRSEIFFPELLMAGDSVKASLELLKPELRAKLKNSKNPSGRFTHGSETATINK